MTPFQRRLAASVAAIAIAGAAAIANAQTAAAPEVTLKPACESPGDPPGKLLSGPQRRDNWVRSSNAYLDCLKKFITDQQAAAEPHIKAANAAIDEYNASTKKFNAIMQEMSK